MDQTGVVRDTKSKRYAVKFNIHNKLYKWLELTADANLSRTENSGAAGFAQNQSNPIWVGLNYSPTMEMTDANGNYRTRTTTSRLTLMVLSTLTRATATVQW